jgi:hypothetical protein
MIFRNSAANRQPYSRAFVLSSAMKALKNSKNLFRKLLVEPDAVVCKLYLQVLIRFRKIMNSYLP